MVSIVIVLTVYIVTVDTEILHTSTANKEVIIARQWCQELTRDYCKVIGRYLINVIDRIGRQDISSNGSVVRLKLGLVGIFHIERLTGRGIGLNTDVVGCH